MVDRRMLPTSPLAAWHVSAASQAEPRPRVQPEPQRVAGVESLPRAQQPEPSDAELVAALQRGEDWAATMLYRRVQQPVMRTLSRLLRQRLAGELEDLVQTTFERMIRFLAKRSLDGGSNLIAWSRAVATNVALDFLRRDVFERRLFVTGEGDSVSPTTAPEVSLDSRASLRRLQTHIAAMQPKYAETLLLHDVLGHDLSEIATMMGVSAAAAQSRLVRGRKDLLRRAQRESKR